jgi:iron-sulfur cluster assembly protein
VFNNPNQTSACGCGESVELKPADLAKLAAEGNPVVRAE